MTDPQVFYNREDLGVALIGDVSHGAVIVGSALRGPPDRPKGKSALLPG